jgi:DNA-binding NarL/FixJ family response regulator
VNNEVKKTVRTILVDDYPPFLVALAALLRGKSWIEVVGRAHNGKEGLDLAEASNPDLVLVDFNMPDMDGLAVTRRLKARPEPPRVVVMSFHAEPEYRDMALKAGADGYLIKAEINQEIMPLLEKIAG